MKGKIALGVLGVVTIGAAITGAFTYGRFKEFFSGEGASFVFYLPNRSFLVVGRYPWDGDHLEHIAEMAGTVDGIYDSYEEYSEIDELNSLFYEEE